MKLPESENSIKIMMLGVIIILLSYMLEGITKLF